MIDGRYELVRQLGAGSMGVVHLANDVFLDRRVAIKVIDAGNASDPATVDRFKKEARALAKIRHQNVVQIYAFGPHESSFYFAMEFVEGRSLEAAIDAGDTVDVARGVDILRAIAGGLGAVHDLKLVHRDVKPSNIVIEWATGRPVLIDFGLARRRSASNPRFSITAGTPTYMAPEQATDPDGTKVTFRADIYALACTAYELFTGHAVFEGNDVFTILKGHLKSPPPLLSSHRPDLAPLDAAFTRALAKLPEERHDSATAFVEELSNALKKRDAQQRRDTLAPSASMQSGITPIERVLVLARDEALSRQLTKVTTRVVGSASRSAVVQHVTSASALVAAFQDDPAAIVLIDEESSELATPELVHTLRLSSGGPGASILVVSREWQALRPTLGALGVRDVLPKPLAVQMLAQAVERIVARRSLPASGT
ncbi:MAG: Serine/threonine protein kinase [Myxococcaceae bacterium]|nr:Serine/threonine protein kinase [Myxococcaceae bacterium]